MGLIPYPEPLKAKSFPWLVAEKEAREIQSMKQVQFAIAGMKTGMWHTKRNTFPFQASRSRVWQRMDLGKLKRGLNHGKNGMRHYLAPWYFLEEKFYPDF